MLAMLPSLAPQPPDAGSGWNHLAALPSLAKGFIFSVASDHVVASIACTDRLPLKEQRVSLPLAGRDHNWCDFTSHTGFKFRFLRRPLNRPPEVNIDLTE